MASERFTISLDYTSFGKSSLTLCLICQFPINILFNVHWLFDCLISVC